MPIIQGNHHRHHSSHHADTQNNPQPPPAPPQPRQSLPNPKLYTNSGPRNLLFIFLKWIIMAFILSLFLIFLGFTALVLLHFLFTHTTVHRHSRRHRQQSQTHQYFRNSIDPNSSYSLQDLHNLLPHLNYSVSSLKTRDCAICLEGFKEGEVCRKLPDCTHLFHRNCVDNWLVKVPTCPICRTRVRLDSGAWGSKK